MSKKLLSLILFSFLIVVVVASPTYEDFTTYTEFDENSHLDKTANHIDFTSYRNEDCYLYDDKGTDNFTASFEHYIDFQVVETMVLYDFFGIYCLSNYVDDILYLKNNNKDFFSVYAQYSTPNRIYFYAKNSTGTASYDYYEGFTINTWYYLTINRTGHDFTCKVYSDSERTTLVDTLTFNLVLPNFQYVILGSTYNDGKTNAIEGDIENLDLNYPPPEEEEEKEPLGYATVSIVTAIIVCVVIFAIYESKRMFRW